MRGEGVGTGRGTEGRGMKVKRKEIGEERRGKEEGNLLEGYWDTRGGNMKRERKE